MGIIGQEGIAWISLIKWDFFNTPASKVHSPNSHNTSYFSLSGYWVLMGLVYLFFFPTAFSQEMTSIYCRYSELLLHLQVSCHPWPMSCTLDLSIPRHFRQWLLLYIYIYKTCKRIPFLTKSNAWDHKRCWIWPKKIENHSINYLNKSNTSYRIIDKNVTISLNSCFINYIFCIHINLSKYKNIPMYIF